MALEVLLGVGQLQLLAGAPGPGAQAGTLRGAAAAPSRRASTSRPSTWPSTRAARSRPFATARSRCTNRWPSCCTSIGSTPSPPLFGRTPEEAGTGAAAGRWSWSTTSSPRSTAWPSPSTSGKVADQAEAIKAAAPRCTRNWRRWRRRWRRLPFLAGDAVSAADCTAVAFVQHVLRARGQGVRPSRSSSASCRWTARYPRAGGLAGPHGGAARLRPHLPAPLAVAHQHPKRTPLAVWKRPAGSFG